MDRIQGVTDSITTSGCLSRELARHFGDESSVPQDRCGSCQYCLTGIAVQFSRGGDRKRSHRQHKIQSDPGSYSGARRPKVSRKGWLWAPES